MSTQRTATTLQSLFPDNTTRQITPDRLRDFVESSKLSYGSIHFNDPGTLTPIATVSTWTKAANASVLHNGAFRFSQSANNQLRYDGAVSVISYAIATLTVTAAANNKRFSFALGLNGTVIEASKTTTKIASAGDERAVTVATPMFLAPGDYIELFVMNETDDSDLTIVHGYYTAFGFMI